MCGSSCAGALIASFRHSWPGRFNDLRKPGVLQVAVLAGVYLAAQLGSATLATRSWGADRGVAAGACPGRDSRRGTAARIWRRALAAQIAGARMDALRLWGVWGAVPDAAPQHGSGGATPAAQIAGARIGALRLWVSGARFPVRHRSTDLAVQLWRRRSLGRGWTRCGCGVSGARFPMRHRSTDLAAQLRRPGPGARIGALRLWHVRGAIPGAAPRRVSGGADRWRADRGGAAVGCLERGSRCGCSAAVPGPWIWAVQLGQRESGGVTRALQLWRRSSAARIRGRGCGVSGRRGSAAAVPAPLLF